MFGCSVVGVGGAGVVGFVACAGGSLCETDSPPARLDDDASVTSVTVRVATSTRYFCPFCSTITFEEDPSTKVIPLAPVAAPRGRDCDIAKDDEIQSATPRSFKPNDLCRFDILYSPQTRLWIGPKIERFLARYTF